VGKKENPDRKRKIESKALARLIGVTFAAIMPEMVDAPFTGSDS
jgi:hypothetical protein